MKNFSVDISNILPILTRNWLRHYLLVLQHANYVLGIILLGGMIISGDSFCKGIHVHFLIQSVPTYSPTKIVTKVKSITAREIFSKVPSVKEELWGGEFWTDGYFVSTVGKHANEDVIRQYIKNQGGNGKYKQLYKKKVIHKQLTLF